MINQSEQHDREFGRSNHPHGSRLRVVTRDLGDLRGRKPSWRWRWRNALERLRGRPFDLALRFVAHVPGMLVLCSELQVRVYQSVPTLLPWQREGLRKYLSTGVDLRQVPAYYGGHVINYGVVSTRIVTDAGVNFIVDAFQNLTEVENFKFHGYGTGAGAEAVGNTALTTELTTEYAADNTRPTGSQGEGATANVYRTTATLSPDGAGTLAITEHGIFSQAGTGGGSLLDRSFFTAVNLTRSADSLQTQYDLTFTSGG
jgi:hypothetical protein